MLKTLAHLGLFLAGMVLVDVNLHDVEPLPFWSWSRNKVNWVAEHGEDYDTMFFGSSRMHYAVQPVSYTGNISQIAVYQ